MGEGASARQCAIPAGVAERVRPERGVRPAIRAARGRRGGRDRVCNLCSRTGGCLARRRTGCRTRSSVVCGDVAASGGAGHRATPCWGHWRQGFIPPRNRYAEPATSTNTWSCDEPGSAIIAEPRVGLFTVFTGPNGVLRLQPENAVVSKLHCLAPALPRRIAVQGVFRKSTTAWFNGPAHSSGNQWPQSGSTLPVTWSA